MLKLKMTTMRQILGLQNLMNCWMICVKMKTMMCQKVKLLQLHLDKPEVAEILPNVGAIKMSEL